MPRILYLCIWVGLFGCIQVVGAVFYVSPSGSDGNSGAIDSPWLTIQRAVNAAQAADTVVVQHGKYAERVFTARGGTGEASRIIFQAEGGVTMKGWVVQHPFITIDGFDITGWSASSVLDGYVSVLKTGSALNLFRCSIRDAIQHTSPDAIISKLDGTISSATGGFLAAGFAPGQFMYVGAAYNRKTLLNDVVCSILSVTDNVMTVQNLKTNEGPVGVYLDASYCYGVSIRDGASNCVVQGNVFSNLGCDAVFILGQGNRVEGNVLERMNGWNAMQYGGANHVVTRNFIKDSPLVLYLVSPDVFENWSPTPYSNIEFVGNYVSGFSGLIGAQKGSKTGTGLHIARNVFVDVGWTSLTHPNTTIENNTFLRAAHTNNAVYSASRHPILIESSIGATNVVLKNNIFVDCGMRVYPTTIAESGWYEVRGATDSFTGLGNFVAGEPPTFSAKNGFDEGDSLMNGGDPSFVNLADPLGPDGIPFTDDDGLRLKYTSKLIGRGTGGQTPGAYELPLFPPVLVAELVGGQLELGWTVGQVSWKLMRSADPGAGWADVQAVPEVTDGRAKVRVAASAQMEFFRLR